MTYIDNKRKYIEWENNEKRELIELTYPRNRRTRKQEKVEYNIIEPPRKKWENTVYGNYSE